MKRFSTVIFDLDGTLVDSYQALTTAVNFARTEHGLEPLPLELVKGYVGEGLETLLQRVFNPLPVPPNATSLFNERYDEVCCTESELLEDVAETIPKIAALDIRMGVCTNKPTEFSRKILSFVDLEKYFHSVVGPDLAGSRKPDGAHLLYTIQAAGGSAEETLFVGDMVIDIDAARNASVAVAVIPTGVIPSSALSAREPDFLLRRFSDLLPIFGIEVPS